jgi:GNAT superfamily N-acetyltransferase
MAIKIRAAVASDADTCGRIIYEAFKRIADSHGFPPDFPSTEAAVGLATNFIAHPLIYGVVAEDQDQVLGSNFLNEGDPIHGVGPNTVDPSAQGRGIGRQLIQAILERGRNAIGIRLVQDAFNMRSVALYASLGFEVKEPLLLMSGTPKNKPKPDFHVRPLTRNDIRTCAALCTNVLGIERTKELNDAIHAFAPFVVERGGRLTGYLAAATFWIMNHGVAETEDDMKALILGAAAASSDPVSVLLPIRQTSFFRWCLSEGLRIIKPMTLMAIGDYRKPSGCYFTSVLY